jgi:predicted dithiol-disulfide oxidoreductase (DUF899 family)
MSVAQTLSPVQELVATNTAHFPNESVVYRTARDALLVEEIDLRRHIEHVASQRRALPDGGEVPNDFEVVSKTGPIRFSSLFGNKDTLMVYSMDVQSRAQSAVSHVHIVLKLLEWHRCQSARAGRNRRYGALAHRAAGGIQETRGFANLPLVSDVSGDYTRTYVNPRGADVPGFSVFPRRNGTVYHFYSGR